MANGLTVWLGVVLAVIFLAALLMTDVVRRYASTRQLLDLPNARSSHATPTPRGGGVAIVVAFSIGALLLAAVDEATSRLLWVILPPLLTVAAVGFWDDHGHVSPLLRLCVHAAAVAWCLVWVDPGFMHGLPFGVPLPAALSLPLAGLAMVWFVNLFNFMDGIDAIAALEAVFVALAGALLAASGGAATEAGLFLVLAAATLGFLLWNWPPAKIFMGDVGSGFLGIALAALGFLAAARTASLWPWVILGAVFVTDATITLVRRMLRGERWYKAHRTHAYQHAARRWGHRSTSLAVTVINLSWLLPLAWWAFTSPTGGGIITLLAYSPLMLLAIVLGAGQRDGAA